MKRSFETAFVIGCLAGVAHCIFDSSAASDDASDDGNRFYYLDRAIQVVTIMLEFMSNMINF